MKNEKTKKALTGLEWAIAQTIVAPQNPDEFTAEEFAVSAEISMSKSRNRLEHMVNAGQLKKRKILKDGKWINLFRKYE